MEYRLIEPEAGALSSSQKTGDHTTGVVFDWPDSNRKRAHAYLKDSDAHVALGNNTLSATDPATFTDVTLPIENVVAGDDGLFAPGNFVRGLTSGAVGLIVNHDSTLTIVRVINVATGPFQAAEQINETTDGLPGGDTGDTADVTAAGPGVGTDNADQVIQTKTDGHHYIVFNPAPSTNTKVAFRSGSGPFTVELEPWGPSL